MSKSTNSRPINRYGRGNVGDQKAGFNFASPGVNFLTMNLPDDREEFFDRSGRSLFVVERYDVVTPGVSDER